MAKIAKVELYIVDPDGKDLDDIQEEIGEVIGYHFDVIPKHVRLKTSDIGPWNDNHPLNYLDCPIETCEQYFK